MYHLATSEEPYEVQALQVASRSQQWIGVFEILMQEEKGSTEWDSQKNTNQTSMGGLTWPLHIRQLQRCEHTFLPMQKPQPYCKQTCSCGQTRRDAPTTDADKEEY